MFFSGLLTIRSVRCPHVEIYNPLAVRALNLLLRSSLTAAIAFSLIVVPTCTAVLVLGITSHLVGSSSLLLLHKINLILRRNALRTITLSLVSCQVLPILQLLVLSVEVLLVQAREVEDTSCLLATSLGCLSKVLVVQRIV